MAYTEHTVVKPQVLSSTALGLVEREIVIPQLFMRNGIDAFQGALDDAINVKIPGVLPAHDYGWRNDRSNPIQVDTYAERKIQVSFGGNAYSAVALTDEQKDMDFAGWGTLLTAQARAVARHLEYAAVAALEKGMKENAISLKATVDTLGTDIVEARRVLNAFGSAPGTKYLLVGSDFEAALQANDKFNLAVNVGEKRAESALGQAQIGTWKGFQIVLSTSIAPNVAYAFDSTAFVFLNAAPSVPASIGAGATTSYDGLALRWVQDYDPLYMQDRSVVNTWYGFQTVKEPVVYWDDTKKAEAVSTGEYVARAVRIEIGATADTYPTGADFTKVGKALGITAGGKRPVYVPGVAAPAKPTS